jgi:hypothetical protein
MTLYFPSQSNDTLLAWGRKMAHHAGFKLVDTQYDPETFTLKFVVPLDEDVTEMQVYKLRVQAFHGESDGQPWCAVQAPWTVSQVKRRVAQASSLVVYEMALIDSTAKL